MNFAKQFALAYFPVAVAIIALFFFLLSSSNQRDMFLKEKSLCVTSTAFEQGFSGSLEEQWRLFGGYCDNLLLIKNH